MSFRKTIAVVALVLVTGGCGTPTRGTAVPEPGTGPLVSGPTTSTESDPTVETDSTGAGADTSSDTTTAFNTTAFNTTTSDTSTPDSTTPDTTGSEAVGGSATTTGPAGSVPISTFTAVVTTTEASTTSIVSTPIGTLTSTSTASPTPRSGGLPIIGIAGVNNPDCRSPNRPILLLHGTFSTTASNFSALVPALIASDRCVYALDYGNGGIAAVASSAGQFAAFLARVRTVTGAEKVDVLGFSQGGLVLRTALRLNGLADQVATAVLLAPSFHGTTSALAAGVPASICPSCADQAAGSPLLRQLDAGGDLDGTVKYAVLSTRRDVVVTPVSSQVPAGPGDRVRSVVLEDQCPSVVTDHVHLPAVPAVVAWVVAALQTNGRPPNNALTC